MDLVDALPTQVKDHVKKRYIQSAQARVSQRMLICGVVMKA